MDREQDVVRLGVGHLRGEERVERPRTHERGVDDLTGEDRDRLLEHRDTAVTRHELDLEVVGRVKGDRLLVGAEVVGAHGGDVGLRVGRPGPQPVGVLLGVVLDGGGRPAIGVPLPEDGIDGAAGDLLVAGLQVPLLVGGRLIGVVGEGIPPPLQLGDGSRFSRTSS